MTDFFYLIMKKRFKLSYIACGKQRFLCISDHGKSTYLQVHHILTVLIWLFPRKFYAQTFRDSLDAPSCRQRYIITDS